MKPQNILDVINENIATVSEDLHTLMSEVAELKAMFNVPTPEQPTASGEEGVVTESRRPSKLS